MVSNVHIPIKNTPIYNGTLLHPALNHLKW